jgi:ornithine cyclodeaminase/alanine dehydrogenase-like protein (mu-crystallin family)
LHQYYRLGLPSGEGVISAQDDITELGELTSGHGPGRTSDKATTICDLTGVGVQDTAIALLAYRKGREREFQLKIAV